MKAFVYGTLRKDQYNYNKYYKGRCTFIGYGYIEGSLYTLKDVVYPGFITEGDTMVIGEIYELDSLTSKEADEMEGFIEQGNINNEYNKDSLDILDINGNVIDNLPVYTFNLTNPKNKNRLGELIPSGDYVAYMNEKKL